MRTLLLLLPLIALLLPKRGAGQTTTNARLRPFLQDHRWGYLDSTGRVVLTPRFRAAGEFAEGLAAVREQGLYGFIDGRGQLVLPARYDYATGFRGGYALVWVAGQPQFITREGKNVLPAGLSQVQYEMGEGRPDYLHVATAAGRQGLLELNGRWLVDTLYGSVGPLREDRVVVKRYFAPGDTLRYSMSEQDALLDGRGRVVVPFGRFTRISRFAGGRATAERVLPLPDSARHGYDDDNCIIDRRGNVLATLPGLQQAFEYDMAEREFHDGVVRVKLFIGRPDTIKVFSSDRQDYYAGIVDSCGRVAFHLPQLESMTPFAHNRAWARTSDRDTWYLVDKAGHLLNQQPFERVVAVGYGTMTAPEFRGGRQCVQTAAGYAFIDSTGRVVGPPRPFNFEFDELQQAGELLIFREDISTGKSGYSMRYGFWNPATGLLVPPRFHDFDPTGFRYGLLYVMQDGRYGYLDRAGKLVWQQAAHQPAATALNIDFMGRSAYLAASPALAKYRGYGGWGGSSNKSRKISPPAYQAGKLNVQLVPDAQPGLYQQRYAGHPFFIANATADTVVFEAEDSRVYAQLQAQDAQGRWLDIEYIPHSWCGNSYHQLFLAPGQQWQFTVPAYEGSQATRLRLKLVTQTARKSRPEQVFYSNEIAGSVNPAQFWRKRGYTPGGIMDPYVD